MARNTRSKKPVAFTAKGIARAKEIAGSAQGGRATTGKSFKSGPDVIPLVRIKTVGGAGATTLTGTANLWMRGGLEG